MKKICYTRPDGHVEIANPHGGDALSIMTGAGGYPRERADRDILLQTTVPPVLKTAAQLRPFYDGMVSGGMSEDAAIDAIALKDSFAGWTWVVIEAGEVPNDPEHSLRAYRNALEISGGKAGFNLPKARNIHREILRKMREPLLAALDVDYIKADEAGNIAEKQRIAAKKQLLRDVTKDPRIDAATSVEELKAVIPSALQ